MALKSFRSVFRLCVRADVPQFILQALDSAARSANDGQCCESDSLEEIVVDCDIPTAAFAQLLNGRVGRLRRIVFTQLPVKACHDGMQPPTQTEQQEAPSATPLELLLLLLEEIPPNQLEVVGLNFSLRPDTNQAAEETPELRARVQALRSSRGKPGAPLTAQHFGNALLQLLTERQSASVRYLWVRLECRPRLEAENRNERQLFSLTDLVSDAYRPRTSTTKFLL